MCVISEQENNEQLTEILKSFINLFNIKYNEIPKKDFIPNEIKKIAKEIHNISQKNLKQLTFNDTRDLFYDVIDKKQNIDIIIHRLSPGPNLI